MVEDSFLYCVTLFTFSVIFALCYLRHVFTFFERNRIPSATSVVPSFPWGNVKNVIFQETAIFLLLWKYYTRIKKKAVKIGGFYIFFKPAFLIVDRNLSEFLKDEDLFEKTNFEDESLTKIQNKKLVDFIITSLLESGENLQSQEYEMDKFLKIFLLEQSFKFSNGKDGVEFEKLLGEKPGICANFRRFLQLVSPTLDGLIPCGSFSKRKSKLNKLIEIEHTIRKKNDVRKDDLIRIFTHDDDATEIVDYIDTCVNLISFCLHELSVNRDIQDDLRGEILRFLKATPSLPLKKLTIEDIQDSSKLTYLDSVICETLRKFPPKPFISRKCRKSHQLNSDIKTEAESLVFVSIFGLHHDPENYTNPEMFDPDRFSEENISFIGSNKFLPFGYSPPPTETLWIKTVMKVGLISLLSRFKFSLGRKAKTRLNFDEVYLGIRTKNGLWFNIESVE